jgi:non-canonical (house-cleaning) NTP pyrophosphatase
MSDSEGSENIYHVCYVASKNQQKIDAVNKVFQLDKDKHKKIPFMPADVKSLDIDDYGTSNQPFGFIATFACAYKRCIVSVEHLKKNGIVKGIVIALENGQYIDRENNVNIGYDFCACVIICLGEVSTIYASCQMPNIVKVPVCEEYLDEVIRQGKVHYTEIDGTKYRTGFDMTIGSLYEKYRGMNKRDWMAESCGVTRESQLMSSLTYTLSYLPIVDFDRGFKTLEVMPDGHDD